MFRHFLDKFAPNLLQNHCSGIAFSLQKYCYFYCSKFVKILKMNIINETWGGGAMINNQLPMKMRESDSSYRRNENPGGFLGFRVEIEVRREKFCALCATSTLPSERQGWAGFAVSPSLNLFIRNTLSSQPQPEN